MSRKRQRSGENFSDGPEEGTWTESSSTPDKKDIIIPKNTSFLTDVASSGSSSSTCSSTRSKTKSKSWSHQSKSSLPNMASKWTRQHAKAHLNISYAKYHIRKPADTLLKISGVLKDLTKEQLEYIELVHKYLQFHYPLKSFYHSNEEVSDALTKCLQLLDEQESKFTSEKTWSILEVKVFFKVRLFITGLKRLARDLKDYRNPFEGLLTGFIGDFADLCCLKAEYCNQARQAIWENLKGIKVTSEPDLRLFKCGLKPMDTDMVVSVVEVKPDSCYTNEPMGPPRKRFKGNPRRISSNTEECVLESGSPVQDDGLIELDLHDGVLGQHAAELLLDLHKKHKKEEATEYEDDKIINMLGMIVDETRVYFTILEMSWKHYQKLVQNKELDKEDKATIYYSTSKDILDDNERKVLMENFMSLNNIDF